MKLKYVIVVLLLIGFVGDASGGEISFNAVTNVITVTGFTQANPCTFLDIYNADVAGGWGKVNQVTPWCYHINQACFYIGNATHNGYFGDAGKEIILKMPPYQTYVFNAPPGRSYLQFGEIDNVTLKTTKNGCDFTFEGNSPYAPADFCVNPVELYLYGCKIQKNTQSDTRVFLRGTNGSIWQTHFNNGYYLQYKANNLDMYDVTISNCGTTTFQFATNLPVIKMDTYNARYGIALYEYSSTTIGMTSKNVEYLFWFMAPKEDHYLIDCDMEWNKPCAYWGIGYKVLRQYTFNLQTIPNAEITIYNNTSVVYNGFADTNGIVSEQTLTMGYYTKSTGSILNSQNPYRLKISKPGYQTYTNTFTLDAPVMWDIGLEPERIPLDKSGVVTGLGFLIGCMIVSIGLIIMKRREFL